MCQLPTTYRELRIVLHALSNLKYTERTVDNLVISQTEFNDLMDKIGSTLGDELRKRELANAHHIDALTPEEDRRSYQIPQGVTLQFPGPDRRDMREKALHANLYNVHKKGTMWYGEDADKKSFIYSQGKWVEDTTL